MFRRIRRRLRAFRFRLRVITARRPIPRAVLRNIAIFYSLIIIVAAGVVVATLYPAKVQQASEWAAGTAWRLVETGSQLVPGLIEWIRPEGDRSKDVIKEVVPYVEVGPEPLAERSIIDRIREAVEFITGYDFSDPRSFFLVEAGGGLTAGAVDRLLLASLARPGDTSVPAPNRAGSPVGESGAVPEPSDVSRPEPEPAPRGSSRPREGRPAPETTEGKKAGADRPPADSTGERLPAPPAKRAPRSWGDDPLVLIFHHHASETYGLPGDSHTWNHYRPGEGPPSGVIQVGARLAESLREYGVPVVHHRAVYDYPVFSYAYAKAEAPLRQLIEGNPQLVMVLDIHRDAGSAVTTLQSSRVSTAGLERGQEAAKVAVVVATEGMKSLPHPNWRDNYQFARVLINRLEGLYPELSRGLISKPGSRYNQHLHPHAVILEIGGHEDELEDALRTADLLAEVLVTTLEELVN